MTQDITVDVQLPAELHIGFLEVRCSSEEEIIFRNTIKEYFIYENTVRFDNQQYDVCDSHMLNRNNAFCKK